MKLPNIFKKSMSIEDEYDEAENVITSLVNEKLNRTPTCKSDDDAFLMQHRLNMGDAEKKRDDLLTQMEYTTYCKINTFPLYTPCTLESMAERCNVPWWRAKRIMMMEITGFTHGAIKVIEILVPGRVATTMSHELEYKTSVIMLPNFRFVESHDRRITYIERIE